MNPSIVSRTGRVALVFVALVGLGTSINLACTFSDSPPKPGTGDDDDSAKQASSSGNHVVTTSSGVNSSSGGYYYGGYCETGYCGCYGGSTSSGGYGGYGGYYGYYGYGYGSSYGCY